MNKQAFLAILITVATANNSSFCMEIENKSLKKVSNSQSDDDYKKNNHIFQQNAQDTYNTTDRAIQYNVLKTCIYKNDILYLTQCLVYKFNPNRYYKQLSLLHCAIQQDSDTAISLLARFNADLTPLNNAEQTPLDYAISLNSTKCINAMARAIAQRYNKLFFYNSHCGLVKHILTSGPCLTCIGELNQQLRYHGLSKPCNNIDDVIACLNS